MTIPVRGYAEGFYGRLLSWAERRQIVDTLQALKLSTYYYAPKEDVFHRLSWRLPYPDAWLNEFSKFCSYANARDIHVVAGVAPGLDFDFAQLPGGDDFALLTSKCMALLDNGAEAISLLMDDIDADFHRRCGSFEAEGQAHAALANSLSAVLTATSRYSVRAAGLWVTPRIYADELIAGTPNYLTDFVQTLDPCHLVLYCGSDVVAQTIDADFCSALRCTGASSLTSSDQRHRVVIWDNLYANDYCPRRLFIGPWTHRYHVADVLLNPTGMVFTDCLLLELMAVGLNRPDNKGSNNGSPVATDNQLWQDILEKHGVPAQFSFIAPYFFHPVFNTSNPTNTGVETPGDTAQLRDAIEHCLWRWKTPLSREWYPAIFGLKHDLLTLWGEQPAMRIRKTQNQPLAERLLKGTHADWN